MVKTLLLMLSIATSGLFDNKTEQRNDLSAQSTPLNKTVQIADTQLQTLENKEYFKVNAEVLKKTKALLQQKNNSLKPEVINKVLITLECASQRDDVHHNNILTIIDFSLPSNKKRLWIFDLKKNKLLFHTYVSHGIKSGTLTSNHFSNRPNSKASSIGIYNTEKAYRGRHGLSLKLQGLEKKFNSNAYNRFIVMHGSWYVNKEFIKKYGRIGRSWGCPTVPVHLTKPIINTIKDNALLVAYYPSDRWLVKSKFLNCKNLENQNIAGNNNKNKIAKKKGKKREAILFADLNDNKKREENEPVVTISADNYQNIFNRRAPLKRMLRRQINEKEYIVLLPSELKKLDKDNNKQLDAANRELNNVYLVIPEVKKKRGYWATEMKVITIGKIKSIKINGTNLTIHFKNKDSIDLRSTDRFIRWLGL